MNRNIALLTICSVLIFSCGTEQTNEEKNKATTVDTSSAFAPKDTTQQLSTTMPDGPYEERHPNGLIKIKGEYAGGKRHGSWLSFYPDGKMWSEGSYKNGLRYGRATAYYPNGNKRYEGFYTDDKETGKWQYWEENGKLAEEKNYSANTK